MNQKKRYKISLPSGDTLWISGDTISEAFINGWEKYSQQNGVVKADPKRPTVKQFVEDVYKPTFFPALKEKTRYNYEQYLALDVIPFLGKYYMDEVHVDTIQRFYNWLSSGKKNGRKTNLKKTTIQRVSGFTSRIFKVAFEMGIIKETPFKQTLLRIHAEDGTHHNAMDDDVIAAIKQKIPYLQNEEELLFMTLLVFMGMRPEEVYGLRWEDLNLEENYGVIQRAVTYPHNNKPSIDAPKTEKSGRTILIASTPKSILTSMMRSNGFILGGESPWCYSHKERVRKRAFEHLGIVGFTPYDFRTTFATQAKESGQTSAQVADLLGHKDTRMVEHIYARTRHQSVMKQLEAIERLNE